MVSEQKAKYEPFMREALNLAEQGRYTAFPNPTVGAVLLRDGAVVARGFHRAVGQDHAETACLKDAADKGLSTAGATLVVTLEPCNHYGKTPPCTKAILQAGISKVVVGTRDINPLATGGIAVLREAGLEVIDAVLENECRDQIADFLVWQTTGRPYVILKMAATLDGRIATRDGNSQWISSEFSRRLTHLWRADIGQCGGVVLVGGRTFRADNPRLTARYEFSSVKQPLACILTTRLPEAEEKYYLPAERPESTIFFTSAAMARSKQAQTLRSKGVRVLESLPAKSLTQNMSGKEQESGMDLGSVLTSLRSETGCPYVLCEGGGRLALSLLEGKFVDEFRLHLAPKILGDAEAVPLFAGRTPENMAQALSLRVCESKFYHGDVHLVLRPENGLI